MTRFQKFDDIKKEWLKDPEFKAAYDALEPEYQLARTLIKARLDKKLTQAELAKKVGLKQTAIARLESGTTNPTYETLYKVAKALDKRVELVNVSK